MNHIICVIDRSGSMQAMRTEAINGFNSFLEKQKADNTDDALTFVQFDDEYQVICVRRPLEDVEPLSEQTYVPRNLTALHDAIGQTIENTKEWSHPTDKTILMVLTDGHENASRIYTKDAVKRRIEHHERKYGWEVIYCGPDIDAYDVGAGLGVRAANIVPYNVSKEGTMHAYQTSSDTVSSHKTGKTPGTS